MSALAMIVMFGAALAAMAAVRKLTRRRQLRQRFGAEYDRLVTDRQSKKVAEAELMLRQRHVSGLGIRPLTDSQRDQYAAGWSAVREKFADIPDLAVLDARYLVCAILVGRGYPLIHREQVISDLSVQHSRVLDHFRAASDLADQVSTGAASMLDMREAMAHYRVVIAELLGEPDQADSAWQADGEASDLHSWQGRWPT
jgi:hypothetical protein